MKLSAVVKNGFILTVVFSFVAACANNPVHQDKTAGKNDNIAAEEVDIVFRYAPDWVKTGSTFSLQNNSRLFLGVNSAPPMGDMALQKSVADDRARAEVSILLLSFLNRAYAAYMHENQAMQNVESSNANAGMFANTLKSGMTVTRIIKGGWRDSGTNNVWSIAELDFQFVKDAVSSDSELNGDFKQYFEISGADVFDLMYAESSQSVLKSTTSNEKQK